MTKNDWDVIVIGSGGAGLCAAVAAGEAGQEVLLLSKGPVGRGCATAYAGGLFSLAVEGMTVEEHLKRSRECGRYLNEPHLLNVLVEEAPARVLGLRRYGVQLELSRGLATCGPYAPSPALGGIPLTTCLWKSARELGVAVQNGLQATNLTADGSSTIVETVRLATSQVEAWRAKAVVVATGGGASVFGRNDNPGGATGDGYALLFQLGVPFEDMEFVQFYPLGFADPGFFAWNPSVAILDDVRLTNSAGDPFIHRLLPTWGMKSMAEADLFARAQGTLAVAQQWEAGHEVYLYLNELTPEQWKQRYFAALRRFYPPEFDPASQPVRVAPTVHFMCGGATITADGETSLPGVYACGEVAGGLHGADRAGGNAYSEMVVFGQRAGLAAARWAREQPASQIEIAPGEATQNKIRNWTANTGGALPGELQQRLNEVVDRHLGPLRTGTGIEQGLIELERLEEQLPHMRLERESDLRKAFEMENLCLTARLVAQSALARRESRGQHFREDHPQQNDAWLRHVVVRRGTQGPLLEFKDVTQPETNHRKV